MTAPEPRSPVALEEAGAAGGRPQPRIVGLDLSLTCVGLARRGHTWTIKSTGLKTATLDHRAKRLAGLADSILNDCIHAALVVIEGPSHGQQRQGGQHDRAGLWWIVVHRLTRLNIPVVEVSPACRAKYATGKGNAAKADVMRHVARRFPWFDGGEDEADALILCAMGHDAAGQPIAVMPTTHRAALAAVTWPDLGPTTRPISPTGPERTLP
jgi:crossover junction endodeoxyribonuclease RuvC